MRRLILPSIVLLLMLAAPIRSQEKAAEPQEDPSDGPSFIPHDVPPKLENSKLIERVMQQSYPRELRGQCGRPRCAKEEGPSGTAVLWLYIDDEGVVQKAQVQKSSGYEAMDEAAMEVAKQMKFSPAKYGDVNTAVWFLQAISFATE